MLPSRPVTRDALPAGGAAGQDRPHAPGRLPTCCRSRSVADCAARGAADVLPARQLLYLYAAQLRCAGIAPYAGHSGSVAGPVLLPVAGPTLPARGAAGANPCNPTFSILPSANFCAVPSRNSICSRLKEV